MRAAEHPLYRDEAAVRAATLEHLAADRSIFQMFQFGANEIEHSAAMLALAAPPHGGRVLSLGCGVGGMERYWQLARPDLAFELVNISAAQLDLCACEGELVLADAQGYVSPRGPFDVVVLACMLGHVDVLATLESARANLAPGGCLLVADVFDSMPGFDAALHYASPMLLQVHAWGARNGFVVSELSGLEPVPFIVGLIPEIRQLTRPAALILREAACSRI